MIKSFCSKETRKIWEGQFSKTLPQAIQAIARRKLRMLNNATSLDDLRIPSANRLEPLSGRRSDEYSIRINQQWRICFRWNDGPEDVGTADYH